MDQAGRQTLSAMDEGGIKEVEIKEEDHAEAGASTVATTSSRTERGSRRGGEGSSRDRARRPERSRRGEKRSKDEEIEKVKKKKKRRSTSAGRRNERNGSCAEEQGKQVELKEQAGPLDSHAKENFVCNDVYRQGRGESTRSSGRKTKPESRGKASRSLRSRRREKRGSRILCSRSRRRRDGRRRRPSEGDSSGRSSGSGGESREPESEDMHSGRDEEGLSRRSGRVSLSSSSALWDAPGQATVATEKVIRLFKKFFRMLRKRPCSIRQEGVGRGSPSKDICVVPHDCEKSVYRDRCPRPFIAKAEAAVAQAKKDGKGVCELAEQDLIWRAAVLIWATGFNIKQTVAMVEEAGDGQETTRVWNSYMKGVTQSNIELGERAGAQVDWQKRPDLVILGDGYQ